MRPRDPDQAITEVAPRGTDLVHLRVAGGGIVDLAITGRDRLLELLRVESGFGLQRIHPLDQLGEIRRDDKVSTALLEGLNRPRPRLRYGPLQEQPDVFVRQIGILLRPREGELALDDPLVKDKPGVVTARLSEVLERAQGVEARKQRGRQAVAQRVEPHR